MSVFERRWRLRAGIGGGAVALALTALTAAAHNGVVHATPEEAAAHAAETAEAALDAVPAIPAGLPFAGGIGGPFELVDHNGEVRTETDPDGLPQLIFFGYATCQAMCSVAVPRMAEAAELLDEAGLEVRPILITVDPRLDTQEAMREYLAPRHPRFLGLTGDDAALETARDAFQVEATLMGHTPDGFPIYAHGTYIYLMDADGAFLTIFPPILGPERIAEVAKTYIDPQQSGATE